MKKFLFVLAVVIILSFLCIVTVLVFAPERCCKTQSIFVEGSQVTIQDETPLTATSQEENFSNVSLGGNSNFSRNNNDCFN